MAKRITEHRVRNWAIGGGTTGGVAILLLFAFLSSLGSIEVTGYSRDMICAGTLEDPCLATINFTAKEDIFIYPSENWSNSILETDKSVNSVKMFRSWGTGWREIKLNQVCTGTWCGASGDAAYSFAFREGNDYTIKYEVLKNSPYDKIKWSFGPVDPLFDSIADIELVSESNTLTHGEAVVKITPKLDYLFDGSKVDTWVNKITPAMDLNKYEMSIGGNMSYQEEVWVSDIVCNPWNETSANETIIEHSNCTDDGYIDYITKYKITYLLFENQNFQLTENVPLYLKVSGEWPAQIGEVIYDWKIDLDGYITPYQWWNSSWYEKKEIKVQENSGNALINYSVLLNITYDSEMLNNFSDLRFLNSTENGEIPYWIENKVDGSFADIWVKVPSLSASVNNSIYMYYNNSAATVTTGNENNTFLLYDAFDGANTTVPDTSKWNKYGTPTIVGNKMRFIDENIYSVNSFEISEGILIEVEEFFIVNDYSSYPGLYNCSITTEFPPDVACTYGYNFRASDTNLKIYNWTAGAPVQIGSTVSVGVVGFDARLTVDPSNNNISFYYNNGTGDYAHIVSDIYAWPTTVWLYLGSDGTGASTTNDADNLIVRRWADPEPTYYIGVEQYQDFAPTVTLNTPADAAILTSLNVIFNCTVYDDLNLTNVTLYIDGVLNETNTSGINNTNYLFDKTLASSGSYNWTCQGVDNSSQYTNGTLRTFSIKLNLTGWVKDNVDNFLSGTYVFITNQSDNITYGTTITDATGYWSFGPVSAGNYFITGYDPTNSSRDGDAAPWIVVP